VVVADVKKRLINMKYDTDHKNGSGSGCGRSGQKILEIGHTQETFALENDKCANLGNSKEEYDESTALVNNECMNKLPTNLKDNYNTNVCMENDDSTILLSDNPAETCLFICAICQMCVAYIKHHTVKHHQLSLKEYLNMYPKVFQRKTHHRYNYHFHNILICYINEHFLVYLLFMH
jgi:hypothetical protein